MLAKDVIGKEIIDRDGNKIGVVDDIVFTGKGKVTHIIALPVGIIRALKPNIHIQFEDIESIEDVVFLKKTEEELKTKKKK
ncbi:MAG: PRC-barrel domain-containing protein [Candidatus Diapherotrites archaeon]|nr:PRC-barrel domain-containing protein [Candidatus Diapherotrites archaeon]